MSLSCRRALSRMERRGVPDDGDARQKGGEIGNIYIIFFEVWREYIVVAG